MSLSKPCVTYRTLTFEQKIAAIREVEKGIKKKCVIAKEFGIASSTLSTFLKNKNKIMSTSAVENGKNRKRMREPDNPDVDACVLKWFKQARDQNIPVSGTLVRAKAEEFSRSLGNDNFKASSGWLDGFKERNGISFKSVCGESASVNADEANVWNEKVAEIIKDMPDRDIFNVDETGLFFKCVPAKTLAFKGEKCSGGKLSKDRLTLLVGANMDGSEKLPLLMVGKSQNPRCFKNVQTKPVEYRSNKKAWMTGSIFEEWLLNLDRKYRKQKRKIILFIDNCSGHNSIPSMENVRVIFFPPNMTSVVQPMDQGVIKNLKHFYRCLVVRHLLTEFSQSKITVLDASRMCLSAWSKVSEKTIANCFRKAGFVRNDVPEDLFGHEDNLPHPDAWESTIPFDDYVNVDNSIEICGHLCDKEILSEVISKNNEDDDENSEDEMNEQRPIPSAGDAVFYLAEIRRLVESKCNVDDSVFRSMNIIEDFVKKNKLSSLKQSEISEYFKKL